MNRLTDKEKNNALNEVRILASLNHPNIIKYRDAFYTEDTETLNIVMDFATKGDLNRLIETHKREKTNIPEEDIWKVLVHVSRGLKCLHLQNTVHRDLKGANIFIN
jgi:NIMA (never in mitosis gene a)-related kinase